MIRGEGGAGRWESASACRSCAGSNAAEIRTDRSGLGGKLRCSAALRRLLTVKPTQSILKMPTSLAWVIANLHNPFRAPKSRCIASDIWSCHF